MSRIFFMFITTFFLFNVSYAQSNKTAVTRIIKKIKNDELAVDVSVKVTAIDSIDLTKFARLVENVPEGCTLKVEDASGADAKIKENKVSLLWVRIPSTDFHVKYSLTCSDSPDCNLITGQLDYIVTRGVKKRIVIENIK
ncbi:MAG: hypothetical protein HY951_06160 [Bacteroidia bacterium]|nr:hypothetical protein [Bacteroidia bacterium]